MTSTLTSCHQCTTLVAMSGEQGFTRAGFLGGIAAAGTAAFALPAVAAEPSSAPCPIAPPWIRTGAIAVSGDGKAVWTTDVLGRAIAGHSGRAMDRVRSIPVGGAPVDIAVSYRGRLAVVATGHGDHPGLAVVDLHNGRVDRIAIGPDPRAVALTRDGSSAWVAGGGAAGTLTRLEIPARRVHPPIAVGAHPRDLALLPDGEHALVTLNGESALAVVSLARGRVVRRIATAAFPYRVAASRGGTRALVSHNGFGADSVTPVDPRRGRAQPPIVVGPDPGGVAFLRSGPKAVVAVGGPGRLVVVDTRTGRRGRSPKAPGTPRGVAVAGARAFIADTETGLVRVMRIGVGT